MATWQADFFFKIAASDLPDDYRERLSSVLPIGHSWSDSIELWGDSDSDRIDVSRAPGTAPEIFCRFDLREWKPELYGRFIECVRSIGGHLTTAEGEDVGLELGALESALRSSSAARFVADPETFLRALTPTSASEKPWWRFW